MSIYMHITNRIGYPFLKILVFVICFVSYEYNESNQKNLDILPSLIFSIVYCFPNFYSFSFPLLLNDNM